MKTKKSLSIIFQVIQGLFILGFILSLFDWSWLNENVIVFGVLGIFWLFLNVITWVSILNDK